MISPFTEPDLIAYAALRGVVITPSQLKRWRAERLLPPVRRPGLGRGKGRETLYPAEAGPWVVDLATVLATDRSFRRAGWSMWLKGYPLSNHARSYLVLSATRLEGFLYQLAKGDLDKESLVFAEARRTDLFRVILSAGTGQPISPVDLATLNARVDEAAPGMFPSAKAEEFGPRMTALGTSLANAPDDVLRSVRDEVLLLRFVLEFVLDLPDGPPTAWLMLLWFGATRASPAGQQILREVRFAIASGRVSLFLERLRPCLDVVRKLFKPLRQLSTDSSNPSKSNR